MASSSSGNSPIRRALGQVRSRVGRLGGYGAFALEALRQAKFPVPPAGMTLAQLTYEVPYYFR